MKKSIANTQVFYRMVKAPVGHRFTGLYAVEKVFIRDNVIYKKEIVHEWDSRILSEASLARLGGDAAFSAYYEDHPEIEDLTASNVVPARTKEEVNALPKTAIEAELKNPKQI